MKFSGRIHQIICVVLSFGIIGYFIYDWITIGTPNQRFIEALVKVGGGLFKFLFVVGGILFLYLWIKIKKENHLLSMGQFRVIADKRLRTLKKIESKPSPNNNELFNSLIQLSSIHSSMGDFRSAESYLNRCLEMYEKSQCNPTSIPFLMNQAALLSMDLGRFTQAEEYFQREAESMKPDPKVIFTPYFTNLHNRAVLCLRRGQYDEAMKQVLSLLDRYEKKLAKYPLILSESLINLTEINRLQEKLDEADAYFKRALPILEKMHKPDDIFKRMRLYTLAKLRRDQRRFDEAETILKQAIECYEKPLGPDYYLIANCLIELGRIETARGNAGEAEKLHRRALAIREKAYGPNHYLVAESLHDLAELHRGRGDLDLAEALHQRALGIFEKTLGLDPRFVKESARDLASLYRETHRPSEAQRIETRVERMPAGNPFASAPAA